MDLNDLLRAKDVAIDPQRVLVLRHTPKEPRPRRVLPQLAAEKPEVFNAYQQTQGATVEKAMKRAKYVASFIGHESGKAIFVGLYEVGETEPLTQEQYWKIPALIEMRDMYGMKGFEPEKERRSSLLWFHLDLTKHYAAWKGKLIVEWPPPGILWFRRADKSKMPVLAIREESALELPMQEWNDVEFQWAELKLLSTRWRARLKEWRGIYYIFDTSDGKGYVGSAYGEDNLDGRWLNYAASGHGGNSLLRKRDPQYFRFTILQRVSPDMDPDDVIRLENTWKERLHTRVPYGLNDN